MFSSFQEMVWCGVIDGWWRSSLAVGSSGVGESKTLTHTRSCLLRFNISTEFD